QHVGDLPQRLSGGLRADPRGLAYQSEQYSSVACWRQIPADHIQGRYSVFARQMDRTYVDGLLPDRVGLLRLDVCYPRAFDQHERAAVQCGRDRVPDRVDFGADYIADLQAGARLR